MCWTYCKTHTFLHSKSKISRFSEDQMNCSKLSCWLPIDKGKSYVWKKLNCMITKIIFLALCKCKFNTLWVFDVSPKTDRVYQHMPKKVGSKRWSCNFQIMQNYESHRLYFNLYHSIIQYNYNSIIFNCKQ